MNKKLIAAAIAAAMVAPAAYAEATLYGKIHTSIDSRDTDVAGGSAGDVDNWEVNSHSSRLGVKGSEDLGGGLKAIYQFETTISSDGDGGPFGSQRNTFVGLAGGFGTFLVGRHDTPAKIAFYAAGNERLGDSIIDINGGVMGVFTEVRASDAIAYVSPNFSGFTFAAAVIPGEQSGTATVGADNDEDGLMDNYSLGLMYKGGGLKAGIGYERLADTGEAPNVSDQDQKMLQAGASYTFGAFSVGAQYEDTNDLGNVKNTDYTAWALTGKATFGNNAISLVYTDSETERTGSNTDTNTDGWGVAAEHNFSKRTKVYAAYATEETDHDSGVGSSDVDDDRFSIGMIHNF